MNKVQLRYYRYTDKRVKVGNTEIVAGKFVHLNPEGGKNKGNLGGKSLGPYSVLGHTSLTLVIKLDELVEIVNIERITKAPPTTGVHNISPAEQTPDGEDEVKYAKPADMRSKKYNVKGWLVETVAAHRVLPDVTVEFHSFWEGPHGPTW